jgi:uncharacterized Ntn-hydrolase superfamily protein
MTYSILARDPASGAFGAAVASRFFAVGAICTYAEGRVGALSTQALVNPMYGPRGMQMLRDGAAAEAVVRGLVDPDPGRAQRQFHVIDAAGRVAQHTGPGCVEWAGHAAGHAVSVAGNMLAGPEVVAATLAGFEAASGSLVDRLLAAMQAGEDAGGDKRGKQSAALRVHLADPYPDLDIRADDHPDPLAELRRLHRVGQERFAVFRRYLAGRDDPHGTIDRAVIEAAIAAEGRPQP